MRLDRLLPAERTAPALVRSLLGITLLLTGALRAHAGGPRFVTGSGMWTQAGQMEGWNTTQLLYYTDPGALSATVPHAQADAMVAAAAAVWNVPTSSLSLAQGGQLAEHVSSDNTSFDGSEAVFPADVQAGNEGNIPVPVLYDTDGSVTELLLGSGASQPLECRQNAVTETVDDIQQDGHIHHALLILNGLCVGSTPEQMQQMQYQLARAFGRILGLAWSQANDNVFTGATQVVADQEAYWPLMHPLDVLCGTYSYQCMVQPFTLRPDDLSSLEALYPVPQNNVPAGKQASDTDADFLYVNSTFPNGQGMDWVNFAAHRVRQGAVEDFELVSGVTGAIYQQAVATPLQSTPAANSGTNLALYEGRVFFRVVPVGGQSDIIFTSQAVNPLYWGEFALGPSVRGPVAPSGSAQTWTDWSALPLADVALGGDATAWDAAADCPAGGEGSENAPAPLPASGWQPGVLCNWGTSSWWSATVPAGRTWAFEVTATNEAGAAVIDKAAVVFGMWNLGDPTGTQPTVASVPVPFNSMALGVTQAQMPALATDTPLRFSVGDLYGAGRPDFTYTARLLCLDSITPTSVGSSGGTITVLGTGFRPGMAVYVNGVAADVTSAGDGTLTVVVPSAGAAGVPIGTQASVAVVDTITGASSSMAGALTYTAAQDILQVVTAPARLETGIVAGMPWTVQVLASDGLTPLAGASVTLSAASGMAVLSACGGASSCTLTSAADGTIRTMLSGTQVGTVLLNAVEPLGAQVAAGTTPPSVSTVLQDTNPVQAVRLLTSPVYVAAGAGGSWTLQLEALLDGALAAGAPVSWNVSAGLVASAGQVATATDGTATFTVAAATISSGASLTVTGCVWNTFCTTWTASGVDPSQWRVAVAPGTAESVSLGGTFNAVTLLTTDAAGHALQGAPVSVYQRVLAWQGTCTAAGNCPPPAVLRADETSAVSAADGTVQFSPLQLPEIAQSVQVAVSSGTLGFTTATLEVTP